MHKIIYILFSGLSFLSAVQAQDKEYVYQDTLIKKDAGKIEQAPAEDHTLNGNYENERPDVIFLEGQSSLRNPSGPCGSELLVSGNAKKVILVHAPKRTYFDDDPKWGALPTVQSELSLIQAYGSEVIGLALNTKDCTLEESRKFSAHLEMELKIPVVLPLEEGVSDLIYSIQKLVEV